MDLKQDSVHFPFLLNRVIKLKVLSNRACISGFFYFLKRVRVSNQERMSVSNLYSNIGLASPLPPPRDNMDKERSLTNNDETI